MDKEIILASKSGVRKKILEANNIKFKIEPSNVDEDSVCLLYTSPSPRDGLLSRMPSSA